jgi:hypothetical protein
MAAPLIAISGWSTPELETVYARAMQLCNATAPGDARFEVERGLYNLHLLRGDLRTADAIADRLLAMAAEEPEPSRRETLMLVGLPCKALPAFYRGEHAPARRYLLDVLALHDATRHAGHAQRYGTDPAVLALTYLAWMDAVEGDRATARTRADRALEQARAERHVFSLCYASCLAASVAQLCGDAEAAARHAAEALRIGNRHNFEYWIAWAQAIEGWAIGLELPADGVRRIDEARDRYLATGSTLVAPYFEALACRTARRGNLPDAGAREARLHELADGDVRFWHAVHGT